MFFVREPTNVDPRDFSMVFPDHFSVEGRFAYFCHFFPGCPLGIFAGVRKFSNKHRTTKINLLLKAWRRVLLVFQQLVPNCVNGDFKKTPGVERKWEMRSAHADAQVDAHMRAQVDAQENAQVNTQADKL